MFSVTVEFQRFGDETGVLRPSDRYIRTVGTTAPAEEVQFNLEQSRLVNGMNTLDYSLFNGQVDAERVRENANRFLSDISDLLERQLPTQPPPGHDGNRYQVEVVTRALELSQLPFEALSTPEFVVTRRIRQPWPPPLVVNNPSPRVLFAWAEPKKTAHSSRRMNVPFERHREHLDELLSDWGGLASDAVIECGNVSRARLAEMLGDKEHGFTHVHLLAHGIGPPRPDPNELFDINRKPESSTFLALEKEDGTIDRCSPEDLGRIFEADSPRPASFAIATCHSGEIDPIESGGTLAHVLHAAGVPVVLASQLALTQEGSDELITTFLAGIINGDDPREAFGACRDALSEKADKTYYDRVALVGYIHVDGGPEKRLQQKQFKVALARLKAASNHAKKRVEEVLPQMEGSEKGLSPEQRSEAEEIAARFASVRKRLSKLELKPELDPGKDPREELYGLQASSLKREAEAAWDLGQALSGDESKVWLERSRDALRDATDAYARAATWSRDHHWSWVQWLVLEAVTKGSLDGREDEWIVSRVASLDAVQWQAPTKADSKERKAVQKQAIWALGSLVELCLLSPMIGRGDALEEGKEYLDQLVKGCADIRDKSPIQSTLDQLGRYETWWGPDPEWPLPAAVVKQARALHSHLKALEGTN